MPQYTTLQKKSKKNNAMSERKKKKSITISVNISDNF